MLTLGKFPTQVQCKTLLHNPISQNFQFPPKPTVSLFLRPNFHAVLQSELCCNALNTQKNDGVNLKEMDGSDEFEEEFDDEFLDLEDDGEIDDDEVFVPLENMKRWQENRPPGFGEGKEYDTSIEDKLMEEIEQSRKAQLANINKLKNSPVKTTSQKGTLKKDIGPTISQDGIRVRLVNLPKKKNIHKDLRVAFKEVPGIVSIVPVVSGNEKTRDPVCKGLAFVDFKNQDEAQRFIQNFSGKSISFGKVQKQIKCEMMSSNSDKGLDVGVVSNILLLDSSEESVISEDDEDEMHALGQWEEEEDDDEGEINGISTTLDPKLADELEMEVGEEPAIDSSSSNSTRKVKKARTNEKKASSKGRKVKSPKLNIPGSANKLKIRDKAILSDVFSKYGANATSTVKEHSR